MLRLVIYRIYGIICLINQTDIIIGRWKLRTILLAYAYFLAALLFFLIARKGYQIIIPPLTRITQYEINASLISRHNRSFVNIRKTTMQERIAIRLQKRLKAQKKLSPPLSSITNAIKERQKLLQKSTTISIIKSDGDLLHNWEVSLQRYPLWIMPKFSLTDFKYEMNNMAVSSSIEIDIKPIINSPVDVTIEKMVLTGSVVRVATNGVAKYGEVLNADDLITKIKSSFENPIENKFLEVNLSHRNGEIINYSDTNLGKLQLLATGKSNFKGSTWARSFNVRKAISEHVNNVIVPPGAEYSFNRGLDGPVSERNGWKVAKVIYEGDQLRPAPGGGICQASTTTYRAILNAGLPVTQRRSHSLFVSYYKEYGVGIDATIYPGSQDLGFLNDTGNYLLIQAYHDGYDVVVNIYGTPDGRQIALDGPFFSTNAPPDIKVNNRNILGNEIVWKQYVVKNDGEILEDIIVSRYKTLPSYVKYSQEIVYNSNELLHAAAGNITAINSERAEILKNEID